MRLLVNPLWAVPTASPASISGVVHTVLCVSCHVPFTRSCIVPVSDGARCLKVGVHEKPDLPEAFHKHGTREFGGESGGPPFPQQKNEFVIGEDVISSCLVGLTLTLLFSLFLVDILSRSHFLSHPHPTLTISMQIWTNYETYIFKKWGTYPQAPMAPTVIPVALSSVYCSVIITCHLYYQQLDV